MNKLLTTIALFATYCCIASYAAELNEIFSWKQLEYKWPSQEAKESAIQKRAYIPENNLPLGLDRWKNKLFVTVPRWKAGVAASLNYVELDPLNKTSALTPYPTWAANTLPEGDDAKPTTDNHIVSVFRVKVDSCDRLWVMDTGLADILGEPKSVSTPALVVYDLNTDTLLRRYTFKPTDMKEDSFFANVIVDVTADKCDSAFAYVPDLGGYGIVVYSWARNDSWRVKHNFFHFDPLKGDFNVGGINFQWTDGVFGLALSKKQRDGYRTLYFHPLASTKEFSVQTNILQNETLATSPDSYYAFKIEGERGDLTQASASDIHEKSEVLFLTQLNRDSVACWNTNKPLTSDNLGVVAHDKDRLIFTNDLKVDNEDNLFILSDRMPAFIYRSLNPNEVNYRIFKIKVQDAIANTPCAN